MPRAARAIMPVTTTIATVNRLAAEGKHKDVHRRASPSNEPPPSDDGPKTCIGTCIEWLNAPLSASAMFVAFVMILQMLLGTMRCSYEFYLDKHVSAPSL